MVIGTWPILKGYLLLLHCIGWRRHWAGESRFPLIHEHFLWFLCNGFKKGMYEALWFETWNRKLTRPQSFGKPNAATWSVSSCRAEVEYHWGERAPASLVALLMYLRWYDLRVSFKYRCIARPPFWKSFPAFPIFFYNVNFFCRPLCQPPCRPPCQPPQCRLDALWRLRDADRMEIRKNDIPTDLLTDGRSGRGRC